MEVRRGAIVLSFLLAGCGGGEYVWQNSHYRHEPLEKDSWKCQAQAQKEFPVKDKIETISGSPSKVRCKERRGVTECEIVPGSAPTYYTADANAYRREEVFNKCMALRGWYQVPKPDSKVDIGQSAGASCWKQDDCGKGFFCFENVCTPYYKGTY